MNSTAKHTKNDWSLERLVEGVMPQNRFKSDASAAIHCAATSLRRIKLIDEATMQEYDTLCVETMPA